MDAPGVLHHVMARGIERQPIFIDAGQKWMLNLKENIGR